MKRALNFSAGPSVLPEEVLKKAQKELLSWNDSGMSVMEMSHRSSFFEEILSSAKSSLKDIMGIPDNYEILFLQGGASTQFAMIPLNLLTKSGKFDLVNTGAWSKKAKEEGSRYGICNEVASSQDKTFSYIPEIDPNKLSADADYFYMTTNNTIYGTRFTSLPDTKGVPIVADMSSNILSQEYKVSDFGLIFAGAQKNMGPAGVTIVIIRKDLIGNAMDITPTMLKYKTHSENDSMFNTPPTFSIYMCSLVFDWIKQQGGIKEIEKINIHKANLIYDYVDNSDMFSGTANKADRSLMNIPFITGNSELDAKFIKESQKENMYFLKGHRSVGGMRASIYNAMPTAGVKTLVEFMKKFEMENK